MLLSAVVTTTFRRVVVFFPQQLKQLRAVKIFSGNANRTLAEAVAKSIGRELGRCTVNSFPDGETFVKIEENVRGEDVFIIQPSSPPTNHHLMELFIMTDAVRRASANRITAVVPFYGYARQDRKDQPRVPITAKLVANLLTSAGVHRVLTMDLHAPQIQGFFDIPVDHLYAKSVLIGYLRERHPDTSNLTVVSPDVGGVKMARAYADALGAELAIVAKHRVSATRVEAMNVIGEVEGRDVLLVDDMTETAGTLTAAAEILHKNGAKRIYAGVSHAILGDLAHQRLRDSAIEEIITTDSVPQALGPKVQVVGIAPLLGEAIRRIHGGQSITSLFSV